ncbi:DUF475 domain-containing protein [Streptacidiphilus jiangxiensis]|uniref:Integral membrane protein, YkoY family n=1 Tax=Streptacidiphilus jiangxiensis TaxID=235985 RepID=A0A1H7W098_STRJI|nr:DUF475 domain-containing protein [Streptacidiphilus jiangxiensis]SEM14916.1 hypothetical protein SAMN05414137_119126 [Streptacidiphilus jiangxiensis]
MFLRTFGWSFGITLLGLAAAAYLWGASGFGIVLVLSVLEISLSFDNAVINATVLRRMSGFWQRIFLTVGVLVAVFGMRLVFPLVVVGLTAHIAPFTVLELALDSSRTYHGRSYAEHLDAAHPAIAAFGAVFLLMIFLEFLCGEKEIRWIAPLERVMERVGRMDRLPVVLSLGVLLLAAHFFAGDNAQTVLVAGIAGLATYLLATGLAERFESVGMPDEDGSDAEPAAAASSARSAVRVAGKAAFVLFVYLEILDASFSFDGVVGAFAISQNIFQIALGLGIGAVYIRSLTVHLVRQGTLDDYVYLEHGAHYAIGALAVILMASIRYAIPEVVTGLIGVAFIALALLGSELRNRRGAAVGGDVDGDGDGGPGAGPRGGPRENPVASKSIGL